MKISVLINVDEDEQEKYLGGLYAIVSYFKEFNGDGKVVEKVHLVNVKTNKKRSEYLKNIKIFDNEVEHLHEALKLFQ